MKQEPEEKGTPFQSARIGLGVITQIALAVLIILLVNYLGFRHYLRGDYSRSQEFRLATQTKQILRELEKPARITLYFSPTQAGFESLISRDLTSLLKELQFSGRPHIEVEYIDPTRNLRRAQEVQSLYQFPPTDSVLVVEYDGRNKQIPIADTADFDFDPVAAGDPPRVIAFRGEQVLASALLGLLDPGENKVYFLQGHGEPSIAGNSPISVFLQYAIRQNLTLETLDLSKTQVVPEDAATVVCIAPDYDITGEELAALKAYWQGDGRIFLLLNPDAETPNLDALSSAAGISPEENRVLRIVPLNFAIGIVRDVAGVFLAESDITKRFAGVNTLFPDPVQSLSPEGVKGDPTIQVRPLIEADESYWGETDHIDTEEKGVAYDDGMDRGYPVYLAVSAERGAIRDDRVDIGAAKMIVTGNSRFVFDDWIGGNTGNVANLDFAISGLNWLLDRKRTTGIIPKVPQEFRVVLTESQLGQIALYTMIVIPGAAAILGFLVWIRRRS